MDIIIYGHKKFIENAPKLENDYGAVAKLCLQKIHFLEHIAVSMVVRYTVQEK